MKDTLIRFSATKTGATLSIKFCLLKTTKKYQHLVSDRYEDSSELNICKIIISTCCNIDPGTLAEFLDAT